MLRIFFISVIVLILQTGFYIKAGNQIVFSQYNSFIEHPGFDKLGEPVLTSKDVLFVVKHSKSPNLVVYEAKRTAKKELDPQKPVDVYWLMKTKGAKTEALTLIEWKLAFGFKLETILKGKKYKITLNAIKDQSIYITQDELGNVEGFMKLNDVMTKLKEVFIKFEHSFFLPDVKYVDFKGVDLFSGKTITQRFSQD